MCVTFREVINMFLFYSYLFNFKDISRTPKTDMSNF